MKKSIRCYVPMLALFALVLASLACTSSTPQLVDTQPSTATSTPLPSPTPTPVPLIIDALAIIDSSVSDIEKMLGEPAEIYSWGVNEIEELPNGGESRDYKVDKFVIAVSYYQGIAVGIQIIEGLDSEGYILDDWQVILARVGVINIKPPDRIAPAGIHWDNYQGYIIWMVTNKIGGNVWTVKVYKLTP